LQENILTEKNRRISSKVEANTLPKPQSFKVNADKQGHFRDLYKINLNEVPSSALEMSDRCTYPVVIELISSDDSDNNQILISYYKIVKTDHGFQLTIIKQVIKINNVYKLVFSLYGTSEDSQESECLICLTEVKTIAVLPCRHVCYCEACLEEVKKKNKQECPVCRAKISSFLNVKHN
jgi:RING-finger-containing ubiquitin ligase